MSKATNIGALIAQLTEQRALDLTNPAAVRAYLDANSVLHHSAASALEHLVAERDAAVARADACERQAVQWKGEALAHKSSLHEAYQILTGAKGEPANWNGARPFREFFADEQVNFIIWLRSWAKYRFGKWITHNTAKGAYMSFVSERRARNAGSGEQP